MRVTLVGMGCTGQDLLPEARHTLEAAELVVGSERLCAGLAHTKARVVCTVRAQAVASALREAEASQAAVLLSGDTGFFSGAARLIPLLRADGHDLHVVPGISSVQLFAARVGRPWQDWVLESAHGRDCDVVGLLQHDRPVFLLTSGAATVRAICDQLVEAGLDACQVTVGERLGHANERLLSGSVRSMALDTYDDLNVMLVELPPNFVARRRSPGIPDDAFVRGDVPMTKQEVRACILAKLAVTPHDVCWDVGAGTGAVSVELALASKETWAVERDPKACALVRQNRQRLHAWNLRVVSGTAPEALAGLPRPDVVFVGGSSGNLVDILDAALASNANARMCVSAIALETLSQAITWMERKELAPEVTQVSVSRTRNASNLHLLMANNPVFLVVGSRLAGGCA